MRSRKEREGGSIFAWILAEPAWDILLQLYAYELLRHRPDESELAQRVDVPQTTSVRWMKVLEADNLIRRDLDASFTSRVWVCLTAKGLKAWTAILWTRDKT